jgi:hypothetical protein
MTIGRPILPKLLRSIPILSFYKNPPCQYAAFDMWLQMSLIGMHLTDNCIVD